MELTTFNREQLLALANETLLKSNSAESVDEKKKLDDDLDEIIARYNKLAKNECYAECKKATKPMHTAILTFYWKGIKLNEKIDKETKAVSRSIDEVSKPIDLGDLHKFMDNCLGANPAWLHTAEKFNFYMTYRAAERVGGTALKELLNSKADCYAMNKIAREIDLGKTPTSNTNLLKTLQLIIDQMLGTTTDENGNEKSYKVTSHDVNYLVDCYANDNKKSKTGITAANHKTLRGYLKKVCYRILTNGSGYDVDSREIKKEK